MPRRRRSTAADIAELSAVLRDEEEEVAGDDSTTTSTPRQPTQVIDLADLMTAIQSIQRPPVRRDLKPPPPVHWIRRC